MANLFPCPSCGGQLIYDASSHQMKCESCGSMYSCDEYKSEDFTYDREVVTCPNCGGEVAAPSLDGMNFCPYCGAEIANAEHFSAKGYPDLIIPFEISKNKTIAIYRNMVRKVPFLPDELKSDEGLESFVGLYTPYWIYDFRAQGQLTLPITKTETTASYIYEYTADLVTDLDCDLSVGLDASQTLDDTVSEQIEPFYYEEMKDFNPNYMAGFYAENSTVQPTVYASESMDKARNVIYDRLNIEASNNDGYSIDTSDSAAVDNAIDSHITRTEDKCRGAYFPLWFLTTRKNNRVAYTVVNGQTGAAYADLPVDIGKFIRASILLSAICAVVFMLLFAVFGTIDMKAVPYVTLVMSCVLMLASSLQSNKIYRKENHLDDLGYNPSDSKGPGKKRKRDPKKKEKSITAICVIAIIVLGLFGSCFVWLLLPFSFIIMIIKARGSSAFTAVLAFVGAILSAADILIDPYQDILLYGLMIVNLLILLYDAIRLTQEYNRIATNPLPQFGKKGGGLNEKYS